MVTKPVLLICSGDDKITVTEYKSIAEAQAAMEEHYQELMPPELLPDWDEYSFCGVNEAKLFRNGNDVWLWRIYERSNG